MNIPAIITFINWALYFSTTLVLLVTACARLNPPSHPVGLALRYHDTKSGFSFYLSESWCGYSVLHKQWEGQKYLASNDTTITVTHGPVFVLRHPCWTPAKMYQDITLVLYTRGQWDDEHQSKFSCNYFAGGTMVELWHNHNYVLAMSTHEGKAELEGWQEVNRIVSQNVHANPPRLYPE